jgi:acetolactate synthase I/II/III large subunit
MHGGHAVVRTLEALGTRYVFSVCGASILAIYDALGTSDIRLIHTRHEAGAVHMADGWARVTGECGVCLVTQGPGVTNTVTGALVSRLDGIPLVILGGRVPESLLHKDSEQPLEGVRLMRSVTKSSITVTDTGEIPRRVSQAFRLAKTGKPGPVFVEIPSEVLESPWRAAPVPPVKPVPRRRPSGASLKTARKLMARSRRPVILGGSGITWWNAIAPFRAFVEATGAPVFVGGISPGVLPSDHPQYCGLSALSMNPIARWALRRADLIIAIGERFEFPVEYGRVPFVSRSCRTIQVELEEDGIGHNRRVDVGITGDPAVALRALATPALNAERWLATLQAKRLEEPPEPPRGAAGISPAEICRAVTDAVADRPCTIIGGGGDIEFWARWIVPINGPRRYLFAYRTGCLGVGIPYGLAAKLARPDDAVIVLVGDGDFGYAAWELETAARYNLPVVVVIANDQAWGMIKHEQQVVFGETFGTDLTGRPYEQFAQTIGGAGGRVDDRAALPGAIARALAAGVPAIVNVLIAPQPSPELQWSWQTRRLDSRRATPW